ncbi:MAG: hypothetical protein JRE64_05190 [Deltaproteobacteria bacterium]|nr:hypothetical protein [Deltaproteobacteria bacterium]
MKQVIHAVTMKKNQPIAVNRNVLRRFSLKRIWHNERTFSRVEMTGLTTGENYQCHQKERKVKKSHETTSSLLSG